MKKIILLVVLMISSLALVHAPYKALAYESCGPETSIIDCPQTPPPKPGTTQDPIETNPIFTLLREAVKFLSGLIGVLAVIMFIAAGVVYASAGDSSDKVRQAKTMMTNTVIGIALYVFLVAIINFLVPGGVFGND